MLRTGSQSQFDCSWSVIRTVLLVAVGVDLYFVFFLKLVSVLVLALDKEVDYADDAKHQHAQQKDGETAFKIDDAEPVLDLLQFVLKR